MNTLTLVNIEFAAATHLMMSLVLFFFSRRSVQFLSQAWIMLLICLLYCGGLSIFDSREKKHNLGILHPVMLIYLMICSFLLSVYTHKICIKRYLQWGRMWGYAIPALCVIFIYGMGAAVGSNLAGVYEFDDFIQYFLSGDILLRIW